MARTQISSKQILDFDLGREDMNISRPGNAMITQVQTGPSLQMNQTGADPGTGIVTLDIKTFTHTQLAPSMLWTINHNLHRYPAVTIFDSSTEKQMVFGDIHHIDVDNLTIEFTVPFSGEAIIS